jgi:hypothetical protein
VTQKISSQYEHFYYIIYNIEKNNFLADVYISSALGGLKKTGFCQPYRGALYFFLIMLSSITLELLALPRSHKSAVEADLRVVQAYPGVMQAHHRAMETYSGGSLWNC